VIDAHAHLTDDRIAADLDQVIRRAAEAGVTRIVTCGEDVASSERAVALAHRYPKVSATVGIHPHRAASAGPAALRRIRELAGDARVIAIGEIGIDLSGRSAPIADQERAFLAQLRLAADLGLPACVHVRDAGDRARDLVDRVTGVRGYVHCYSEGPEQVDEWVRRGFSLSFAGTVTFPRSDGLRAAAAAVPADRLLIETDAPYLAPQPQRGRRNEPAFVPSTYAEVARVRGTTADRLAERVRENAASLFGDRW
jgi:TatD DNase family protein